MRTNAAGRLPLSSKIKQSRDEYIKRLNAIYETNLKNVSVGSSLVLNLLFSRAWS